jgi:MFS family permease
MSQSPSWRRNVVVATTASLVGTSGFTLVIPMLPLYFKELGLEDLSSISLWSGLSLGVTPALAAVLSPFWGRLADRYGRKIIVERSIGGFMVIMAALAYAREPWHVFALRAIQGLFGGYNSLTLAMAAQSAPPDRATRAIGNVQTAQRLGPAVGPIVGGVVSQIVGVRSSFFVSAVFFAVALLMVIFLYEEREKGIARREGAQGSVSFRDLLTFENFLLLMIVIFVVQLVDRSFGPVLPLYLVQLGVTDTRAAVYAGVLFSAAALSAATGNQLTAHLLKRWRPRFIIVAAALTCAAGASIYAFAPPLPVLFGATPVFGAAVGVLLTTSYSTASALIPHGSGAAGFGLLTSASLTGLALSPMLAGLVGTASLRAVFGVDAIAMSLLAVWVHRTMLDPVAVEDVNAPTVEST